MLTVGPSMSTRRIRAFYAILDRLQGRSVVQRFDEALARQALSREALLRTAEERLREQLEYAARAVPFYAGRLDAFARGGGSEAAFAAIPPLEKKDIAAAPESLLARGRSLAGAGVTEVRSGGTTGPPTRVALDRETVDAHAAAALRTFLWWGADPTRRHVMLWGCPTEENTYLSLGGRIRGRVLGRTLFDTYGVGRDGLRAIFERVRRISLDHVAGYSSALVESAAAARPGAPPRIRAGVAAAAEPIFDFQRPLVEAAFGAPLFDRYGCNEFSAIAHQCRAGGLHVAVDRVRLDVVREDGTPAPHGEIGSLLVTDLDNRHMPLVRYRIGDLGALGPDCRCGLPFPTLRRVYGRERDALRAADGAPRTPHDFAAALAGTPARGFQILADAGQKVREIHVQAEPFATAEVEDRWREVAGTPVRAVFVESVRRSRSGKILPVLGPES